MGRNNKDFESCPQCYGNGTTGAPNYANTCPTCSGAGTRSIKAAKEAQAKARQTPMEGYGETRTWDDH